MSAAATAAGYLYATGRLRGGRAREERLASRIEHYVTTQHVTTEKARELAEADLGRVNARRSR